MRRNRVLSIIAILLLAGFLRLYKLPENFVFCVDEEYQAYLAQTIIKNFHVIWVGVGSTADFYLGPFWTYLTSGLLFLSQGRPLITGYFAAILGVATTFMVYIVGNKVFNYKTGILAALLYSSLPLIVFFDQKYWNVSLVPLLSLVMFLSIYQTVKNKCWWIIFAAAYGIAFHIHLSLVPFGLVGLIYFLKQRKEISLKIYAVSISVFILMISPLIVFDYFHKWSNLTTPIRLVSNLGKSVEKYSFSSKVIFVGESLNRLIYLEPYKDSADETNWGCASYAGTRPSFLLSIFLLLTFLLSLIFIRHKSLFLLTVATYLFSFLVFPGNSYEYYLLGFFPFVLFIPGILMRGEYLIWRKRVILGTLVILVALGIFTVVTATGNYGLGVKREIIGEVVKSVGREPFELNSEGRCHIAEGWRYLFSIYGKRPVKSSTDKIFGWLYADEISREIPKYLVVVSEARIPLNFSTVGAKVIEKGGFTVYIFSN